MLILYCILIKFKSDGQKYINMHIKIVIFITSHCPLVNIKIYLVDGVVKIFTLMTDWIKKKYEGYIRHQKIWT